MEKHIGTALLAVLSFSSVFLAVFGQPSTQLDIDNIAQFLQIEIKVGTQHEAAGNYDLTFVLTNNGTRKMLDKSDWSIMFSMKSKNLLRSPIYEIYGLQILPAEGSRYIIKPNPTAATPFPGINREEGFTFTVEADGLSMFRTDFYPRFVVYAENISPKNIKSTEYEDLRFIKLHSANDSYVDSSKMTGIRRSLTQPDIQDFGRVPPSIIIPAPMDISRPTDNLIDLSQTAQWYVWPDATVSDSFKNLLVQKLKSAPNVTQVQFTFVTAEPPAGADRIYLQIAADNTKTENAYTLAIRPKVLGVRAFNLIHMRATSTIGLNNALESLMGILGLYNIMPEVTITDDARFQTRSVRLDVTKNFMPAAVIKRFLNLMKAYKLNNLILNLADDFGWRLETPNRFDFPELWTYASQRCLDQTKCLPPAFGSGVDTTTSGSGYYTIAEFTDILQHANSLFITVTPKFNLLGGIRSAKLASHKRYERLSPSRAQEADYFHLMSAEPVLTNEELPEDAPYSDGMLDPCNVATYNFINETIRSVAQIFAAASTQMPEFHAGGDELTQFFSRFPSCISQGSNQAAVMSRLHQNLQAFLAPFNSKLRIDEEAVIDPTTGTCIPPSGRGFDGTNMVVDFWNLMPGSHFDWNLTPEQWDFIDAVVEPPTIPEGGMGQPPQMPTPDPLKEYTGPRKGLAPWSRAYNCANQGYKVVLAPENFFSLDSPYELDFYEPGHRYKRRFHVINLHRMMMFEPLNLHINQDLGNDRYSYLPYRLCRVFQCESLTDAGRRNIQGIEATVDTSIIRNEAQLWYMVLPRLLLFAEKAWRLGPFENLVQAEVPQSLLNVSNVEQRAFFLNQEMINLVNNFGYKEAGILDAKNYPYRVPRPAASIYFGLPFRVKPPYPVVVKVDFAGADIEFRDYTPGAAWKPLFTRDEATGLVTGGYNFTFPVSNQKIQIRTKSSDGKRGSIPTLLEASPFNLFPREIPIELREGTCLPIAEAWRTELESITLDQWTRLISNIDSVILEEQQVGASRMQNLTAELNRYNAQSRANLTLPQVFMGIEALMAQGRNITMLPTDNVYRRIFLEDMQMTENRGAQVERRFDEWELAHKACSAGKPAAAASPRQPSGGRGQGQATGGGMSGSRGGANQQRPAQNANQGQGNARQGMRRRQ